MQGAFGSAIAQQLANCCSLDAWLSRERMPNKVLDAAELYFVVEPPLTIHRPPARTKQSVKGHPAFR